MENVRERSWRGKFHRPGRVIDPEANRRNGRCPLTPLEVAMFVPSNLCVSELLVSYSFLEPVPRLSTEVLMDSS